ncbi:MAG: lysophospholipase [Alphaproteobacteria bacterium]|nr:lysophospholipase [Alphaproteobacteria bacterium]
MSVLWCGCALLALLPTAGCAPPTTDEDVRAAGIGTARAAAPPQPTARFTGSTFVAADGAVLPLREWLPNGPPRAVILALHGFNDYSNSFEAPGKAWARQGIATYAYDQRGFGAAPEHGLWPGRAALAADAATAAQILRRRYPGVPLYLLGESMGGAVAIVAMTGESGTTVPPVDGVILAAPAVWGRATMDFLPRLALWASVRVVPGLTLTGRGLGKKPSDNLAMLRALSRDPLVIKATRVDTIYGLVNLMDAALDSAPRLVSPVFVMYGGKDEIIPKEPIRRFAGDLPPECRRQDKLAWYKNGYHMLLRDLEGPMVIADVASWVRAHAAPLPSGADRAAAEAFLPRGSRISLDTR